MSQLERIENDPVMMQSVANMIYFVTTRRRTIEIMQMALQDNHTFTVSGSFKALDVMGHGYIQYEDLSQAFSLFYKAIRPEDFQNLCFFGPKKTLSSASNSTSATSRSTKHLTYDRFLSLLRPFGRQKFQNHSGTAQLHQQSAVLAEFTLRNVVEILEAWADLFSFRELIKSKLVTDYGYYMSRLWFLIDPSDQGWVDYDGIREFVNFNNFPFEELDYRILLEDMGLGGSIKIKRADFCSYLTPSGPGSEVGFTRLMQSFREQRGPERSIAKQGHLGMSFGRQESRNQGRTEQVLDKYPIHVMSELSNSINPMNQHVIKRAEDSLRMENGQVFLDPSKKTMGPKNNVFESCFDNYYKQMALKDKVGIFSKLVGEEENQKKSIRNQEYEHPEDMKEAVEFYQNQAIMAHGEDEKRPEISSLKKSKENRSQMERSNNQMERRRYQEPEEDDMIAKYFKGRANKTQIANELNGGSESSWKVNDGPVVADRSDWLEKEGFETLFGSKEGFGMSKSLSKSKKREHEMGSESHSDSNRSESHLEEVDLREFTEV